MITTFKKYASFAGRAPRSEYWSIKMLLGVIFIILLAVNLGGLNARALGNHIGAAWAPFGSIALAGNAAKSYSQFLETGGQVSPFFSIILLAFTIIYIILDLAVTIRRIHDLNKSGWWLLLIFPPAIIGIILFAISDWLELLSIVLMIISSVLVIIFTFWLGFFSGARGENRFGSNPLKSIDEQSNSPGNSE